MKREDLEKLGLNDEQITGVMKLKSAMIESNNSEQDKYKSDLEALKSERDNLQEQLDNANTTIKSFEDMDVESIKSELQSYKDREEKRVADEVARKEDELLTNNIIASFGDKKFASDYAKNGLIADIKNELNKPENKGKGIAEISELLTKDKVGIFENPNKPVDMPQMGNVSTNEVSKDAFDKMGYKERLNLKQDNPELYEQLRK